MNDTFANHPIALRPMGDHPTVQYSAAELQRCLEAITGHAVVIERASGFAAGVPGIWLGMPDQIPHAAAIASADEMADSVAGSVRGADGWIAGSNPRSVLLGVYRYLTHLGCRWVRPGPDAEYLPSGVRNISCEFEETPSYRHRGVCIEGAVSEEHVRNMIEWLPRVGMNAYFTQFRESYTFFDRWYTRSSGARGRTEPFTIDEARERLARLVSEIRKRSLVYHAVGHGWTCDPFGLQGLGWEFDAVTASPDVEPYLALVNGKREVWGGIPLNTNLCYSNPEVRRIMVEDMVRYVEQHPEVDLLHVWLADGANNQCECPACSVALPSDWYVTMLNELDRALTAARSSVRVVFLIYVDLLWPPEHARIANPDRFMLMFAPITRSYSRSFAAPEQSGTAAIPPYVRNRLTFPRSVEENVAFLKGWERAFRGDSFDFDYHMMWDHYNDPGYSQTAQVLHQDVCRLKDIGLHGLVSCQVQRAAFPTGLMLTAMAGALWDAARPYSEIENDYYESAFGPEWRFARGYLSEISELFDPVYTRGDRPSAGRPGQNVHCETASGFARIPELIEASLPRMQSLAASDNPVWAASWKYLLHHAAICVPLARAYAARENGDAAEAERQWKIAEREAWEREPEIHNVLDVYLFVQTLGPRFRIER